MSDNHTAFICSVLTLAPVAALFTAPGRSGERSDIVTAIISLFFHFLVFLFVFLLHFFSSVCPFLYLCISSIGYLKHGHKDPD